MSLRRSVRGRLGVLLGALLAASPVEGQVTAGQAEGAAKTAPAAATPVDEREAWRVGFCALEPVGLEPAMLYLAYSIPLVVQEELAGAREHRLSDAEKAARRKQLVDERVRKTSEKLIGARRARDVLAEGPATESAAELEKAAAGIELLVGEIRDLAALDPASIAIADTKPVRFAAAPADAAGAAVSSGLLAAPRYSPLDAARAADADLLVYGSIEQVDEYLFLTVKAVDYPGGELRLEYQDAFGATNVLPSLEGLTGDLADIVLGRPWGRLRVSASPADAEIRIGGELVGVGEAVARFVEAGVAEVAVSREGFLGSTQSVTVSAGEEAAVDIALEPADVGRITLSSSPLLADVYVDSRWSGRTPMEVPRPAGLHRIEIRRDGREGRAFHISPESPAETMTVLPPLTVDPDERQKRAREAFYRSFGAWVVSLPLPLCLMAAGSDQLATYVGAVAKGDTADELELSIRCRRLYSAYAGGLFVNLSLLANMIIELVRYVEAGDRPAG